MIDLEHACSVVFWIILTIVFLAIAGLVIWYGMAVAVTVIPTPRLDERVENRRAQHAEDQFRSIMEYQGVTVHTNEYIDLTPGDVYPY